MFDKPIEYIYSLERTKKEFKIEDIQSFLDEIGNPERDLKVIHVAGTNGKGSTCAFINQGLIEAGYKVGLFTSPHLVKFNERIRINNEEISDEELGRFTEEIDRLQKETGESLTFFEAATAIAFLYFKEKKVDYVVLETGLGGRLDATNVCKPIISVITPIGIDHVHFLGDSIKKIAEEKAGIIKDAPVFTSQDYDEATKVIWNKCQEKNVDLFQVGLDYKGELGLKGAYQRGNATLAKEVLEYLKVDEETIKRAFKNTNWNGRFDFIEDRVLVDCAHNDQGVLALVKSVEELDNTYDNIVLIFAVGETKDYEKMLKILDKLAIRKRIFTKSKVESALDPNKLKELYPDSEVKEDVKEALAYAKLNSKPGDLILVAGSIYMIGDLYLSTT